jgi:hypothetical protein
VGSASATFKVLIIANTYDLGPSPYSYRKGEVDPPESETMHSEGFAFAQELRQAFILDPTNLGPIYWYHGGKRAAVVLSVDDVFPGTSQSAY